MINNENGRLDYVDIAKAIGIILVVIGHVVAGDSLCKKLIYSFHMPLFFVIAGVVTKGINYCDKKLTAEYFSKKIKRLLVPYGIWALIYCTFSFRHCIQILYGSRELLLKAGTLTSLWFLPVLFTASVIADPIIEALNRKKARRTVCVCAIAVLILVGFLIPHHITYGDPFGIDIAFVAAGLMLFGYLLKTGLETAGKSSLWAYAAVSLTLFCVFAPQSNSGYGFVLMANGSYGNRLIFLICALSGSFCVLSCSRLLSVMNIGKTWITKLGQKSMGVFLIHKVMIEWIRKGMQYSRIALGETVSVILTVSGAILFSVLAVHLIEFCCPEMIGSRKKSDG